MDHNNVETNIKQEEAGQSNFDAYVTENGKHYRVPYRVIKRAVFTNIKKSELVDIPHSGRLQYRLMLMDPVIKATVDFTKSKITILYNPRDSDNMKEKISIDELVEFLAKQGINVDRNSMQVEDYDYYKNLYSYAYNPDKIRERIPYGYTAEQWKEMKPKWDEKIAADNAKKKEKLMAFQQQYLEENPNMALKMDPNFKPTEKSYGFFDRLTGKDKKRAEKGKGFWFHGI